MPRRGLVGCRVDSYNCQYDYFPSTLFFGQFFSFSHSPAPSDCHLRLLFLPSPQHWSDTHKFGELALLLLVGDLLFFQSELLKQLDPLIHLRNSNQTQPWSQHNNHNNSYRNRKKKNKNEQHYNNKYLHLLTLPTLAPIAGGTDPANKLPWCHGSFRKQRRSGHRAHLQS